MGSIFFFINKDKARGYKRSSIRHGCVTQRPINLIPIVILGFCFKFVNCWRGFFLGGWGWFLLPNFFFSYGCFAPYLWCFGPFLPPSLGARFGLCLSFLTRSQVTG